MIADDQGFAPVPITMPPMDSACRHFLVPLLLFATLFATFFAPSFATGADEDLPRIDYDVTIGAADGMAHVSITVHQHDSDVRLLDFNPGRQEQPIANGGTLRVNDGRWEWQPGATGGTLTFIAPLDHTRGNGSVDGRISDRWGLFRGDDLIPPARVLLETGTRPVHRLRLQLPRGWSMASPYGREQQWLPIAHSDRLFDRPTGWFLVGHFGLRAESIAGTQVWVAGPRDQGVRRMDMLAFLRWTMPTLRDVIGDFPDPLLIVSAGDPFFRGGLAAPTSFFMHSDRPLISENGTSSYAHELVHLLLPPAENRNADWITEGLAEYYSVEALRRSGSVSEERYEKTHRDLAEWGAPIERLDEGASTGATTARAVALLRQLDEGLRPAHSLDEVVVRLAEGESLSSDKLLEAVESVAGKVPADFATSLEQLTR